MSVHGPLGVTDTGTVEIRAPAVGARPSSRREPLGLLGLGGLVLTTLLVAVGAAQTNVLLPESVRPVPELARGPVRKQRDRTRKRRRDRRS